MRILAVDDDPITLKIVSKTLAGAGYDVFTARDGQEALAQVESVRPDLIILDVMLPGMDGYEVLRRLKSRTDAPLLPVLMLTADDTVEGKIKAFTAGAADYLAKPFDAAELVARVKALLRRFAGPAVGAEAVQGTVIAVFSLRGGCGVSTIAANLAAGLAQIWGQPVALVDLALTAGHSALLFNLPLHRTWAGLARIPVAELDADLVERTLLEHPSGVRVLAAPKGPQHAEAVSAEHVAQVVRLLKSRYAYVVLDLPHDLSTTTVAGLDTAHRIVLLMTPDLASAYVTARTLDVFETLEYGKDRIYLILNWTFERGGLARKEMEGFLKHPTSLIIPFAPDPIVRAINTGVPPVLDAPESPLGALLEDLAFTLSTEEHRTRGPASPTAAWERVQRRIRQRQARAERHPASPLRIG
ncbi:MAG: response regulator [Chloroflexi bacterium]|nr:response regulator [Chloroflexota bacterium]